MAFVAMIIVKEKIIVVQAQYVLLENSGVGDTNGRSRCFENRDDDTCLLSSAYKCLVGNGSSSSTL